MPLATYRLQFNDSFTFADALALVGYLEELGITDVYASPFLKPRPGSAHGYDVVDHSQVNEALGTLDDLRRFGLHLRGRGMGLLADVVPNHMCVAHHANRWWWDVLEDGPGSPHAKYFDIDWNPPKKELHNRVLLPVLGDQFGRTLESGQIRVRFDGSGFDLSYYEHLFPIAPRTWAQLLEPALEHVRGNLPGGHEDILELESILTALTYLPPRDETDPERVRERQREKLIIRRRLAALCDKNAGVRAAVEAAVVRINGTPGEPASYDELERLLANQVYRLSFWRVAADEINYRRFFDINDLGAIRVEDQEVFDEVHRLLLELVHEGLISGFRVDHPDGLYDPDAYYGALQEAARAALPADAEGAPPLSNPMPFFVVAEKIVAGDEELRPEWRICGTTGYGFLKYLNGIFNDTSYRRAFQRLYARFTGREEALADEVYAAKKLILQVSMSSELNVLARRLDRVSEQHRWSSDFTLENLRDALEEYVACLAIYRTYVAPGAREPGAEDARHVRAAITEAKRRNPAQSEEVFDFLQSVLLLEDPDGLNAEQREERRLFVLRLQQYTGAVMAKGMEDTLFYRDYPLASLNEVGGEPARFGLPVTLFHAKNQIRRRGWPYAMLATTTHDTKRSEDVRARINVLSEIPSEWYRALNSWAIENLRHKTEIDGHAVPGRNEEYLFYQTLAGIWSFGAPGSSELASLRERLVRYMLKAVREAKLFTSWVSPDAAWEAALKRFIEGVLDPSTGGAFLDSFERFHSTIRRAGMLNGLVQVLLKATSPGVPDFYQGSELWDFSLVDPDNRRTVDFDCRRRLLERVKVGIRHDPAALLDSLLERPDDGAVKLFITRRALRLRRQRPDLFLEGGYLPLKAAGPKHNHVVAFARTSARDTAVVLAGRFFMALGAAERMPAGEVWVGTSVPLRKVKPAVWRDLLTGAHVEAVQQTGVWALALDRVFARMPLALLVEEAVDD